MPAVKPIDYPPPFDSADVIGPPTDPVDDRIESASRSSRRPGGPRCANKLMQLLEDEPELTEKLAKSCRGYREGQSVGRASALRGQRRPLGDDAALPRHGPGRTGRRSTRR